MDSYSNSHRPLSQRSTTSYTPMHSLAPKYPTPPVSSHSARPTWSSTTQKPNAYDDDEEQENQQSEEQYSDFKSTNNHRRSSTEHRSSGINAPSRPSITRSYPDDPFRSPIYEVRENTDPPDSALHRHSRKPSRPLPPIPVEESLTTSLSTPISAKTSQQQASHHDKISSYNVHSRSHSHAYAEKVHPLEHNVSDGKRQQQFHDDHIERLTHTYANMNTSDYDPLPYSSNHEASTTSDYDAPSSNDQETYEVSMESKALTEYQNPSYNIPKSFIPQPLPPAATPYPYTHVQPQPANTYINYMPIPALYPPEITTAPPPINPSLLQMPDHSFYTHDSNNYFGASPQPINPLYPPEFYPQRIPTPHVHNTQVPTIPHFYPPTPQPSPSIPTPEPLQNTYLPTPELSALDTRTLPPLPETPRSPTPGPPLPPKPRDIKMGFGTYSLMEQAYLLCARPNGSGPPNPLAQRALCDSLALAIFLELVVRGRIILFPGAALPPSTKSGQKSPPTADEVQQVVYAPDEFVLFGTEPTGDDILDEAIKIMESVSGEKTAEVWLHALGGTVVRYKGVKDLLERVIERLIKKKLLNETTKPSSVALLRRYNLQQTTLYPIHDLSELARQTTDKIRLLIKSLSDSSSNTVTPSSPTENTDLTPWELAFLGLFYVLDHRGAADSSRCVPDKNERKHVRASLRRLFDGPLLALPNNRQDQGQDRPNRNDDWVPTGTERAMIVRQVRVALKSLKIFFAL